MAKRGRKKGSRNKVTKPKTERKRYIKQVNDDSIGKIFLDLTCSICKEVSTIRVNDIDIYTPEVRKNWVCFKKQCNEQKGK